MNIGRNVIHGSDAPETAVFEIGHWFEPSELSGWTPADQVWRVEPRVPILGGMSLTWYGLNRSRSPSLVANGATPNPAGPARRRGDLSLRPWTRTGRC